MTTDKNDEPMSAQDSKTTRMWPQQPEDPEREPVCPELDDEGQMIEEPGYGHGV